MKIRSKKIVLVTVIDDKIKINESIKCVFFVLAIIPYTPLLALYWYPSWPILNVLVCTVLVSF